MCGVAIRFANPMSGEFFGGSSAKVSTAAASELSGFQSFGERGFVNQFAARAIHQVARRASFLRMWPR